MPWLPEHGRLSRKTIVGIQVAASEYTHQRQVRQVGGKWDADQKVWYLAYEQVMELGVEDRICLAGHKKGQR